MIQKNFFTNIAVNSLVASLLIKDASRPEFPYFWIFKSIDNCKIPHRFNHLLFQCSSWLFELMVNNAAGYHGDSN